MKSPLLILFVIFNLLAVSTVSAMKVYEEEVKESHLIKSHDHAAHEHEMDDEATLASCIDESSCDHFCHVSAHMLGFVSQDNSTITKNSLVFSNRFKQRLHSINLDPPSEPPQA
jgi:hypothetical protein